MRYVGITIVSAIVGSVSLTGCTTLITPSGSAATRWAALDKSRAAKARGLADTRICKSMKTTGSNFPQKVCSTQAQWDAFAEEARKSAEEFGTGRRAGNLGDRFEGN